MALTFAIKVPKGQLKAYASKLKAVKAALIKAASTSLFESATEIMSESQDSEVPRMTSTLASTGTVIVAEPETPNRSAIIQLGFGGPAAPYAIAVHENPRAGKTGGVSPSGAKYRNWARTGKWKYLEDPLMRRAGGENSDASKKLVKDLNDELKKFDI